MQKLPKSTSSNGLSQSTVTKLGLGFVIWSLLVFGASYTAGVSHQKSVFDAQNKPLPAPTASKGATGSVELAKATELAKAKQYDQAIALLTPEVNDTKNPTSDRVQGMLLIAQYFQTKTDPESAVKWDLMANKISDTPRLDATLAAASASAQLYALKSTGPAGPKGAASYKADAINYYKQAKTLTDDAKLKSQIDAQLSALAKAQ